MNLQRYMMLRALKSLVLDGREGTAQLVASEIAADILHKDCPESAVDSPSDRKTIIEACAPRILEEAKRQLKIHDWESDGGGCAA